MNSLQWSYQDHSELRTYGDTMRQLCETHNGNNRDEFVKQNEATIKNLFGLCNEEHDNWSLHIICVKEPTLMVCHKTKDKCRHEDGSYGE